MELGLGAVGVDGCAVAGRVVGCVRVYGCTGVWVYGCTGVWVYGWIVGHASTAKRKYVCNDSCLGILPERRTIVRMVFIENCTWISASEY